MGPFHIGKALISALILGFLLTGLMIATSGCDLPNSRSGAVTTLLHQPSSSSSSSTTAAPRRSTPGGSAKKSAKNPPKTSAATWSLVVEPNASMQPIYSLMSSARHELDMTMYELADAQTIEILESDAARGVTVRVILDQDYSGASVNATAYSELRAHGVQVHWAPSATIFHQKTITVDAHTLAVMTLNLTSEYYSSSRDFAIVTTDHSDVEAIEEGFETDWTNPSAPQPGPRGTNLVWSPGAEPPILDLIESARHSLLIENEEMDAPTIVSSLESAARRGVDVRGRDDLLAVMGDGVRRPSECRREGQHVSR